MKQEVVNASSVNKTVADFLQFTLNVFLFLRRGFFMQFNAQDRRLLAWVTDTYQGSAFYFGMGVENRFNLFGKQ